MFPLPSHTLRSTRQVKRFGLTLAVTFALVAATTIAACSGDSSAEGQRTPTAPTRATPTDTTATSGPTEATRLGGGELIAYERVAPGAEERALYAVRPEGGEARLVRTSGDYPHWSPDGSELAFLACLNPPDCTTAVALLERSTGEVRGFPMPDADLFTACVVWAPSGTELACEGLSEDDPARNGVYTVRASDGKGLTRITTNRRGSDFPLAYSPDGTRLLLDRADSPNEGASHALFVAPISGGQPRRITTWGFADDYASWSPDGRTIVFGTNGSLYRVSPEGRGLARISLKMPDGSSAANAFDVSFSPDGTRIVFSLGSPKPGIYTGRLDGSDVQQVTRGEHHHANWGAAGGS